MQDVFMQAVEDSAKEGIQSLVVVCLRELIDWPREVLKQYLFGWRMEVNFMDSPLNNYSEAGAALSDSDRFSRKSTAREVLAALIPLIAWGAAWIYAAARDIFPDMPGSSQPVPWYLSAFVVTLIGLGIGWWKNFPRWSYLYTGLVVTFSAYWSGLAMNGWNILGFYFIDDGRWAWRAWIPFLVLVVFMLLITRSLSPVKQFFTGIWWDWSLLSFMLYGWLVTLFMTLILDGIEMPNEFWLPVWMVLAFLGSIVAYMRVDRSWQRALGLDIGLFAGVAGAIVLGRFFYSDVSNFASLAELSLQARTLYIILMAGWVVVWLGTVFAPAFILLFQKTKKVAPVV
jgi:hypothetical protein